MTEKESFDLRLQEVKDARLRQEARHASALLELLGKRPEQREVIPLADLVGERTRWCA
jgi:ferritin-like protein